jgi:hypothetical protein
VAKKVEKLRDDRLARRMKEIFKKAVMQCESLDPMDAENILNDPILSATTSERTSTISPLQAINEEFKPDLTHPQSIKPEIEF